MRVPHSTVRTAVLPETTHAAATFAVATKPPDALTDSGYGTALVELAEGGTTTVTITVTAEEGTTTQDYTVRVHPRRTVIAEATMLVAKIRYWLVRRICRRYAREYLHDVDRMGPGMDPGSH